MHLRAVGIICLLGVLWLLGVAAGPAGATPPATLPVSPTTRATPHPAGSPAVPRAPLPTKTKQRSLPRLREVVVPPPVSLPLPSAVPSDVPNRPLGADEAAGIALFHQPSVAIAQAGVMAARGTTLQVNSGQLPTVAVNTTYTYTTVAASAGTGVSVVASTTNSTTGSTATTTYVGSGLVAGAAGDAALQTLTAGGTSIVTPGWQVGVTLRQLLFDFNHTRDLVRAAIGQERAAAANLGAVQLDTVLQARQAFFALVQNERLVTVNESNVSNQQAHYRTARARYQAGVGLPADVFRAQAAVAEAVFGLTRARASAVVSRSTLARLMGVDPRTPIVTAVSEEPQALFGDPEELYAAALRERPEIKQAEATVTSHRHVMRAAYSTNSPVLNGILGWNGRGSGFPPTGVETFNSGFVLQWSPYDGGLTAGRVLQARANEEQALARLRQVRLTVIHEVSSAYVDLRTAEQTLVTTETEVANAVESLRLAEARYQVGLGIFLDVLDAQNALLTARTNRVNAQAAMDQARAALQRAVGRGLSR